jgi:uncharacterized ferritin-like protein (DUF455 family)
MKDFEAERILKSATYDALEEIVRRAALLGRYIERGGDYPPSIHDALDAWYTARGAYEVERDS